MSDLRVGARLTLTIARVALDGRGVGVAAEREVHVTGALPPERVEVLVDAVDRQGGRVHATSVALLPGQGARRHVPCPQHALRTRQGCSGCPWMPWEPKQQRDALRALLADAGLPVREVHRGVTGRDHGLGYRWSAKRVAFSRQGLRLGSYRARSHACADMAGCLVDHPALAAAADEVASAARALGVGAFEAPRGHAPGRPGLRYVWLKTNGRDTLVTLITGGLDRADVAPLAAALTLPTGVAWASHDGPGNAIRGGAPEVLRGVGALTVALAGESVNVGPLGFLQPNPQVAARCYDALVHDEGGAALTGAHALDLYAGAGVTTALLRRAFTRVTPCESWPESAALLGVPPLTTAAFLADHGDAPVDLVVANPPRAGLGARVTAQLNALAAPRLHIMSCSPKTLRRDLDALASHYELASLDAFATLPQTPHVELVARLVARAATAP